MSLPGFSVRRPVLTTMVTLIVILIGLVSLSRLQIDLLPSIELPTVSVRTSFEGASPEVMERNITQIIEEILATVPGVVEMTSSSSEGSSRVRVTFAWGTDLDAAAADVRATLEDEINELPDDIQRPRISKFDIDSFPVVLLGISSDIDPVELTQLIEDEIRYRFGQLPGVAQVDLWGGFDREIRVALDPHRVDALGLSMDRVVQAIRDSNLDLPAGMIERDRYEVTLRAPANYATVDEVRDTVLLKRDGAAITIGDVANVLDTYERESEVERINDRRGIRVAIRKQSTANTVEVSRAILAEIERVNADLPQIDVSPVINQGNFIVRSIDNVTTSVLYGGLLAIFVLLFFLRNLRSTVVIAIAIPICVVATFALMYFGGLTLNLMTLGGLALGVGMMVDNSIVVLENIFRRRDEDGEDPVSASVGGAREVGPAIVASTITTLVIFLPIAFVGGVTGLLFTDLAVVIVFALLCSLAVSLSLVPMLASKLLRRRATVEDAATTWPRRLAAWAERGFRALDDSYRDLLRRVLVHRWLTVGVAFGLLGAALLLSPFIGTEFLPPSDEGEVRITGEMEPGTRLDILDRQTLKMEAIIFPAVPERVASSVSVEDGEGQIRISLTPASQRDRSNTEIAADLRERLEGQIPGMDIRVRAPQGQFLLERLLASDDGVTVEVRGYDLDTLERLAQRAADVVRAVPGVTDVDVSRKAGVPQAELHVDRAKIADVGLSVRAVTELVQTAIAGTDAGEFRTEGESFRIFVQLADAQRRALEEVLDLTLTTPSGDQVALRNVVNVRTSRAPIEIDRKDQERLVTVGANVAGRDMGSVASDIQAALDDIARPVGFALNVAGNFEEQQESFRELMISLLLAILLVYMVLASQYESLRDPLVVMLSVPVAGVGVLVTLFLTDTTLNLQSAIGCIMLGGIVVNNAILLVDQAGQLRAAGLSVDDAIAEAGRRRLRPILMTTATTILGLLPLAFGIGEGADAQAPLARAVVGGLAGSTLITLVLIPAVYSLFHPERDPERDKDGARATT